MTKYEALKQKAADYKDRLTFGVAYRDNLEGVIVSKTNDSVSDRMYRGKPFTAFLTNGTSTAYGFIKTDEFTENEMGVLKELVRSHVARLEQQYEEVAAKLQAVEELLS